MAKKDPSVRSGIIHFQKVTMGSAVVTMIMLVTTHLLLPVLVQYQQAHPDIEWQLYAEILVGIVGVLGGGAAARSADNAQFKD